MFRKNLPGFVPSVILLLILILSLAEKRSLYAQPFIIAKELGRGIIDAARTSAGMNSTTFCRKEEKSVIHRDLFENMLQDLRAEDIRLDQRDKGDLGRKNSTFTIYSHAAKFMQGQVKTSIRLRSRFYLSQIQSHTPELKGDRNSLLIDDTLFHEISHYCSDKKSFRAEVTGTSGFLEIKIKSPTESEMNSVLKIRMHVDDDLLKKLYNIDPDNEEDFYGFLEELRKVRREENNPDHVDSIIEIIRVLGKSHGAFLRPEFAVSYQRTAYSYTEPASSSLQEEGANFQITTDSHIKYHRVDRKGDFLNIPAYFADDSSLIGSYPEAALALEFKDPIKDSSPDSRSREHQILLDTFVALAQEKSNVFHGFRRNKGKAANFKHAVAFKNRFSKSSWEGPF